MIQRKEAHSQDSKQNSEDVVEFFAGFEFAETSEYRKLDKKLAKDALLVYERITSSDLEEVLAMARVALGPKNILE